MQRSTVRRAAAIIAALLTLTGLTACAGRPQSGDPKNVKIAAINLLTFSPVYVADKLGFFKDEGLDVTIVPTTSGDASVQAMLGRSVDGATTGFDTPIELTAKGQAVQSLVGMEMATIYAFVGGKNFPAVPADDPAAFVRAVKGHKFGVASSGSTGDLIARGLFTEYGLDPEHDVSIIAVGTGAAATAALQSGAVDALISYEPDLTRITGSGAGKVVFDLRTSKAEQNYSQLPTSTLQATSAWIKSNPDIARSLVRAVARADTVLREKSDTALPVLKGLYPELSPQQIESIYSASRSHFRAEISRPTFDSAMKIYRGAGVETGQVSYEQVVATQFSQDWSAA
ncbi:ABC transporter substrate-binding protein [Amycolatopsis sp. MEPSY49]|uniref:ABC transporter substrate-binding protein n=1 Tax=Amycolatopsis sp. MEPSY49 TaxID=3151600 RepID=UPI003EF6A672